MTTPDLFESLNAQANAQSPETGGAPVHPSAQSAPLAYRMRPLVLEDFVGHEKLLSASQPLRKWIESDRMPSLIFWGPPGCGKTTLGQIIAERTQSRFVSLSAVLSGVKDIKEAVERAAESLRLTNRKTILFVDEIHRFNKSQQDALLPHVENGTVTLIGATTENPSFELNAALLSRAMVVRLERIETEALVALLKRALSDPERGLGGWFGISDDGLRRIAESSQGDARRALGALESVAMAVGASGKVGGASKELDDQAIQEALKVAGQFQPIPYDKKGEEHYNVISAFIKSIRDSDPHAGLYYLARMLEGGEDPLFIARRLVILASEDIGNADPRALTIALSAKDAVDFIGMPEALITLAQAVTYVATAPKSNASYVGIDAAIEEVRKSGALPTPMHLRNGVTGLMKNMGYGSGYKYAHNDAEGRAKQRHLPEALLGRKFYEPKDTGYEKTIKERLDRLNPDFE
jgi:putative ATPase